MDKLNTEMSQLITWFEGFLPADLTTADYQNATQQKPAQPLDE